METAFTRLFAIMQRCVAPRYLTFIILGLVCILNASSAIGATKSKLTKVAKEAKKPVEEQEIVLREHPPDDDDDDYDGPGIFELAAIFLTSDLSSGESNSSPGRTLPPDESVHFLLSSLFIQPTDSVLDNLQGGGFSLRGTSGKLDFEIGAYFLRGEVQAGSELHDGIVSPFELTLSSRVRTHFTRNHLFGLNAFIGGQYGRLFWDYPTSVFAIDQYGYGEEIGRDSINNVSGFIGIGITPIHTRSIDLDINLRGGMRIYYSSTAKGFDNDAFRSNLFSGIDIELVFHL